MKIAQIAPLAERCPPRLYGGTERVVSFLTEELVAQGHQVTLFASGDSQTSAELVSCAPAALRSNPSVMDPLPYHISMLEKVRRRADEFDILHFHIDFLHFPTAHDFIDRTITTLHGRLDLPDLPPLYKVFRTAPVSSISYNQRLPLLAHVNWVGNVYHGLPVDLLPFSPTATGGYLAFIGRIAPEKRPDRAIEIAVKAGLPLKIAAKIDRVDQGYWEAVIAPMIKSHRSVEYVGEINEQQKAKFLGDAAALLFPIDWPEPFGLVMIEAMACGTPVVAFRCGSAPEVIDEGVSGVIVDTVDEAVAALQRINALDRRGVRATFERRFACERMVSDYVDIYRARTRLSRSIAQIGVPLVSAPAATLLPAGGAKLPLSA